MADLDPDFQALLAPNTSASAPPAAGPTGASGLDPDFQSLLAKAPTPAPAPFSWTDFLKGQGNALTRMGAKAVWAVPGAAADAGVEARNLIGNAYNRAVGNKPTPDYSSASSLFNQVLDQYTNAPQSTAGKVSEFLGSTLLGGKALPGAPTYGPNIPKNFVAPTPPLSNAQQTLAAVRDAGYVFPPSTLRPTLLNKVTESLGGKSGTAQDASTMNMATTTALARKAVGVEPGTELTPQLLDGIIKQASGAKGAVIAQSGPAVKFDSAYADGITQITAPYRAAAEELGDSFGNPKLLAAADAINKPQITPPVAMKAVETLRSNADVAFRAGDKPTGVAYKALATNLENGIDRHLVAQGNGDTVDAYRAARELQAKAYDVKDALNPDTGQVSAHLLKRADYLSGDLATAASAARIAPKATKEILDSGSVRNTDIMTGGLAAVMEKQPWYLVYPWLRAGARSAMLSPRGQNALLGPVPRAPSIAGAPTSPKPLSGLPASLFGNINTASQ